MGSQPEHVLGIGLHQHLLVLRGNVERVLYAMDYPYQVSSDEVAAYDALDIPPEHKKMLMQTNAEDVFRL